MLSRRTSGWLASLVAVGVLAACVPATPMMGSKPGDVPPRVIVDPNNDKAKIWNNPGAFGPVPAELAATGQQVCSRMDTKDTQFKAIGYHPAAQDEQGKPFKGGGYFCVAK
jgi:hypothetical protein